MKFRRLLSEVDAVQFIGGHPKATRDFLTEMGANFHEVKNRNKIEWFRVGVHGDKSSLFVVVSPGEWIACDAAGAFFIYTTDIFEQTYEPVESD